MRVRSFTRPAISVRGDANDEIRLEHRFQTHTLAKQMPVAEATGWLEGALRVVIFTSVRINAMSYDGPGGAGRSKPPQRPPTQRN